MAYTINSDGKYDDLPYTNFPADVDSFEDKMDLTVAMYDLAKQYKNYCDQGDFESAQNLLSNDTTGLLKRMRIDAQCINEVRQAVMAIERMWVTDIEKYVKDQVFLEDLMVSTYTHTYDATTKVHNFVGSGKNGKALLTAGWHSGDTYTINGTSGYMAVCGANAPDADTIVEGVWIYFLVQDTQISFIGMSGITSKISELELNTQLAVPYMYTATFYADEWVALTDTSSGYAYTQTVSIIGDKSEAPTVQTDSTFMPGISATSTGVQASDEAISDALDIINEGHRYCSAAGKITCLVREVPEITIPVRMEIQTDYIETTL